jgi:hypothetical protein
MSENTAQLSCNQVRELMMACLVKDPAVESFPITEGLVRKYMFHPERIQEHKKDIYNLLMELDPTFRKSVGGGWSFLQMPANKDGEQWGGQINAEELLVLGIAAGLMEYGMPREMWNILPGGVPYVVFNDDVTFKEPQ